MPGSHGSLSKAGKVRFKDKSIKDLVEVAKRKKKANKVIPKIRNKRNFIRRVVIPKAVVELKKNNLPITRRTLNEYRRQIIKDMYVGG